MEIEELETILSKYRINKPRYRSREVESKSFPFMLTTFSELIKNDIPPTQEEFINNFRDKYPNLRTWGMISRLRRAYLSYVREYHLGFLLRKYFDDVIYDEATDISGVDYIIKYKGYDFNLHAFVSTEDRKYWRGVKNQRHNFTGLHIDIPMDLSEGKKVGKIILYSEIDLEKLILSMEDMIEKQERKLNII